MEQRDHPTIPDAFEDGYDGLEVLARRINTRADHARRSWTMSSRRRASGELS
jgi:hypothetical protein